MPHCWDAFTGDDHAVWDLLFARQVELLGTRVVSPFLDGIDLLRLSHPGVPDLDELNAILGPRHRLANGAVTGLVPDEIFFAMLAARVFPVGNFIRKREQLDYLEEPDCFHDLFGHIPMLAAPRLCRMTRQHSANSARGDRRGRGHRAARLYWYSVEFGLAIEQGAAEDPGCGPRVELRRSAFQPRERGGRTAALLDRARRQHAL